MKNKYARLAAILLLGFALVAVLTRPTTEDPWWLYHTGV